MKKFIKIKSDKGTLKKKRKCRNQGNINHLTGNEIQKAIKWDKTIISV